MGDWRRLSPRRKPVRLKAGGGPREVPFSLGYVPRPGLPRKIAIVGTAGTVRHTPWHDASWEIWSHTAAHNLCQRVDRYFELHPSKVWKEPKHWDPDYRRWLTRQTTPIYMQRRYRSIPASRRYPRQQILAEFRAHFGNQVDWMIALALTEGVTHLGLFGVHYAATSERYTQLISLKYWLGFLEGRGVQLVLPPGCPVFTNPPWLYGYESHNPTNRGYFKAGPSKVLPPQNTPLQAVTFAEMETKLRRDLDGVPALDRFKAFLDHGTLPSGPTELPLDGVPITLDVEE